MMASPGELLAEEVRWELLGNILPFWRQRTVDGRRGGFIAQMSNDLCIEEGASKGLILNARILWTFSAAYRITRQGEDRDLAERAHEYLTRRFLDPEEGGYFWELDPRGAPTDERKKIYGQAFCAYALAEYHRTFGDPLALRQAIDVFLRIEAHAHDGEGGGYFEAMSRDWRPCEDMRLSEKDMNEAKSMNTHLHVLEAYANLLRLWPEQLLSDRLRELICIFLERILDAGGSHFGHFFDGAWRPRSEGYTFGHDIEGSWLLCEAAEVLGDEYLLARVRALAVRMARAALREGLDGDGGLFYEGRDGRIIVEDKEWWPQAEAVVGFYNAWQISRESEFREAAIGCWRFIRDRIVDPVHGEWFWRVARDGTPDVSMPKVSAWKCPYHNGRMCLEVIRRVETESGGRRG